MDGSFVGSLVGGGWVGLVCFGMDGIPGGLRSWVDGWCHVNDVYMIWRGLGDGIKPRSLDLISRKLAFIAGMASRAGVENQRTERFKPGRLSHGTHSSSCEPTVSSSRALTQKLCGTRQVECARSVERDRAIANEIIG